MKFADRIRAAIAGFKGNPAESQITPLMWWKIWTDVEALKLVVNLNMNAVAVAIAPTSDQSVEEIKRNLRIHALSRIESADMTVDGHPEHEALLIEAEFRSMMLRSAEKFLDDRGEA
jgi:hypothetical protein